MCSLQLSNCRGFEESTFAGRFSAIEKKLRKSNVATQSSFWGRCLDLNGGKAKEKKQRSSGRNSRVFAILSTKFKIDLNEYMVTLNKPFGIRFALSVDGKIFVHALQKGGNAEKSRTVLVGDTLKMAGGSSRRRLTEIKDFGDIENLTKEKSGSYSLILERPFSPFPIHQLYLRTDLDIMFNRGHVPIATWNKSIQASNLRASSEGTGSSGFVVFCPKFLTSQGWKYLNDQNKNGPLQMDRDTPVLPFRPLIAIFTEEVSEDAEWTHGGFPLKEYVMALDRSKGELSYNHSLGMRYSKITEQIYVGSCIQTEEDVETLSATVGVTAVLNFQSMIEAANWGIDSNSINESCQKFNILMINYPIRDADSFEMRKRLPFCLGLLQRLLKKNHCVYVTCTTGSEQSPACVIAYLHWMKDTSLHAAYNFVTGLHSCRPDRPAIACATWDLIAMVGKHDGPPTYAVTFVWIGHEGQNVYLVGDFTGNWKEPIKAEHKGGPRYEVEVRLPHGKYYYKFIINGEWRNSGASPTERVDHQSFLKEEKRALYAWRNRKAWNVFKMPSIRGNINNVIVIGDIASVKPSFQQPKKDVSIVKVIERPLTKNEHFLLAKAVRCIAFSVCPIRLEPK